MSPFISDQLPAKTDMHNLLYCIATIQEIQRVSAVAPTSLPHGLTKDISVRGYHFPKGTGMKLNIACNIFDDLDYRYK